MADGTIPLENQKWEHFAQLVSSGTPIPTAYEQAGFRPDTKNAKKLAKKPEVADRIDALRAPVLARFGVDRERWVREVSALAFSDVRDVIEWDTETEHEVDNDDGGEVLVIKHIHSHKGRFRKSSQLSPETAAAVQKVKVKGDGEIEITMHPKLGALRLLGESLRVIGRHQQEETDPGTPPAHEKNAIETEQELLDLFEKSLKEKEQRAANARLIEGTATEQLD